LREGVFSPGNPPGGFRRISCWSSFKRVSKEVYWGVKFGVLEWGPLLMGWKFLEGPNFQKTPEKNFALENNLEGRRAWEPLLETLGRLLTPSGVV